MMGITEVNPLSIQYLQITRPSIFPNVPTTDPTISPYNPYNPTIYSGACLPSARILWDINSTQNTASVFSADSPPQEFL